VAERPTSPLVLVVCGAGGAGKGSVVEQLVRRDPSLWLSRSWTTRRRRAGEPEDAYTWVSEAEFEQRIAEGGFLEWAQFFEHKYGTPTPEVPAGKDLVLEIDVQGAVQARAHDPDAVVVLVLPPSREEQERRMRSRGDDEEHVAKRLAKSDAEETVGRDLADLVVVNDDLDRAVAEVEALVAKVRANRFG
jgi:guanylate kinase